VCGVLHTKWIWLYKKNLKMCNDSFMTTVMGITGHLRRQQTLINEMKSKCPRFINTRWLSMQKLLKWLCLKRPRLQLHFEEKKPSCAPGKTFWIMTYVLKAFVNSVNNCLVAIQGLPGSPRCFLVRFFHVYSFFTYNSNIFRFLWHG
jgi:hypothetical protein